MCARGCQPDRGRTRRGRPRQQCDRGYVREELDTKQRTADRPDAFGVIGECGDHGREDAEERSRQGMQQHSVETIRVCGCPQPVAALLECCEPGDCDRDLSDGIKLPEFLHVVASSRGVCGQHLPPVRCMCERDSEISTIPDSCQGGATGGRTCFALVGRGVGPRLRGHVVQVVAPGLE